MQQNLTLKDAIMRVLNSPHLDGRIGGAMALGDIQGKLSYDDCLGRTPPDSETLAALASLVAEGRVTEELLVKCHRERRGSTVYERCRPGQRFRTRKPFAVYRGEAYRRLPWLSK